MSHPDWNTVIAEMEKESLNGACDLFRSAFKDEDLKVYLLQKTGGSCGRCGGFSIIMHEGYTISASHIPFHFYREELVPLCYGCDQIRPENWTK